MRILLADDQSEVRAALRILLEQQSGFFVVGEVSEPKSLMIQAKENSPDLILLDWELGSLRMCDIVSILKLICPDLKIVALSSRPESSKAALTAGVDAFVSKIDHPGKLLDTIQYIEKAAPSGE